MATAVERLTGLVGAKDCFDIPLAELLPVQLEAARERLASHGTSIRLVENRVASSGTSGIDRLADLVPLLFAHTAYKSYPESWLSQGRWDRMAQWLDTVSAIRVNGVDNADVNGIDDWIDRLAAHGHYICCSSGTTGKVSIVNSAMSDREINKRICVASFEWSTGVYGNRDRKIFVCNPGTNNFRYLDSWVALTGAFGSGGREYTFPGEPVTVGRVREMVTLRKSIADGTARPAEIAAFEKVSAEREREVEGAIEGIVEGLLASRDDKLFVTGMYPLMFKVADRIRAQGFGRKDFHPDNVMLVSGGLKGAALPPDYHEIILDTFNIQPRHAYQMYAMQELSSFMPRCEVGRYHVPPWLMLLPLDQTGETLLEPSNGEVEGRAGFFDLSLDGRWGGIISGDRITVHYGTCDCGHQGPAVGKEIARYSDLPGGDKISCAGAIDAYVRGAV